MLIASPAHQVWEMRDDAGRINAFAEQLPIRFVEGANKERRQKMFAGIMATMKTIAETK